MRPSRATRTRHTPVSTRSGGDLLQVVLRREMSMADEVVLNKSAVIERCLKRITEEREGREDSWRATTPGRMLSC